VAELAQGLHAAGVELVSTGSTAARIAEAGVPVTTVEDVTGFPEILDGRVKTLHPHVHAGLLADPRDPAHAASWRSARSSRSSCWSATSTRSGRRWPPGARGAELVEQIDVGGPAMIRAAAKNHAGMAVVVDPVRTTRRWRRCARAGSTTSSAAGGRQPRSHTPPRTTPRSRPG
jgi:phosphoribosylaminoimidazolecarboxamide formyltransferase/IMP cyclohydrolase